MLKKYAWEKYDEKKLKKLEKLSAEYREFLDNGKTERECVDTIVNTIEAEGYRELEEIGLAAPQVTYLMHDLAAAGWEVDVDATTVEEAANAIYRCLGR